MDTNNSKKPLFPNEADDGFFTPIQNTKPYLKIAAQGFAGSGKTFTLAQLAIGLHKKIRSTKPIVIFDTEESSKFLIPFFTKNKIQAVNKRSRSLADLKETFRRCREGYSDILIIDSISHVWENFLEAYKQKKNRSRLEFQDWGIIKPAWKNEFSDPFVRDQYHVLMTGRAGYEYETEINEETKKREIYKSGVKMKVEGETAYEPDILLYMERFEHILDDNKDIYRQATILKDRSTLIDGKVFKNPTFKDFLPAINVILNDAVEENSQPEIDASSLFKNEEDKRAWFKRRDIALENLQGILTEAFPGQSAAEKKHKQTALFTAYNTYSWVEVSEMKPNVIEDGHIRVKDYIAMVKQESEQQA